MTLVDGMPISLSSRHTHVCCVCAAAPCISSPSQVVALVDGMPTSIYDGLTVYPLGQTVFHMAEEDHRGGLYCFSTVRTGERVVLLKQGVVQ